MVDLILFASIFGAFYGGFWCGKSFKSLPLMWEHIKSKL